MLKLCTGSLIGMVVFGLAVFHFETSRTHAAQLGWDMAQAAQYLDDRMDLRFAKATQLQTGQAKTSCVSCHTVVPYAFARPALRKAMGVTDPTPQEARLLDDTVRRVSTYGDHQLIDAKKDKASRGTEAVLNALILANYDSGQHRQQPGEPTRKAFDELWETQRADGAWDWIDNALEPYESADAAYYGAALGAIAVGTAPGVARDRDVSASRHIDRLRAYLKEKYAGQSLYNQAWMLLATSRLTGLLTPDQRTALVREIEMKQNEDGGWSLYLLGPWRWSKTAPPFEPRAKVDAQLLSHSDGYATGLAAYVLRQAALSPNRPSLQRARAWLQANQQECQIDQKHWKCWRAYSLNYDHESGGPHGESYRRMFMSDSATAFAVLALLSLE